MLVFLELCQARSEIRRKPDQKTSRMTVLGRRLQLQALHLYMPVLEDLGDDEGVKNRYQQEVAIIAGLRRDSHTVQLRNVETAIAISVLDILHDELLITASDSSENRRARQAQ